MDRDQGCPWQGALERLREIDFSIEDIEDIEAKGPRQAPFINVQVSVISCLSPVTQVISYYLS